MSSYYYVLLSLPPLSFKVQPDLSFAVLKDTLSLNLTANEMKHVSSLFEEIDLYNMKAFWQGLPLDERGSLDLHLVEEALLVRVGLPTYLIDYIDKYENVKERISHFYEVLAAFYREKEEEESGFLKEWFSFKRKLRLFLTALRSKLLGRDLAKELQFEDPTDPTVAFLLAQKDTTDIFLPPGWESLKILFVENGRDPEELNRAILQFQFEKAEEFEEKMYN